MAVTEVRKALNGIVQSQSAAAMDGAIERSRTLDRVAEVSSSYLSRNPVSPERIGEIIQLTYDALLDVARQSGCSLDGGPGRTALEHRPTPAVPIENSIQGDHLVCLEDGRRLKMLKRYLRTRYGLSPEAYRKKWGLPSNYPMAAPNYSAKRARMARRSGFGRPAERVAP